MANNRYCVDRAKRGMAKCKVCKEPIEKDTVRIAKITVGMNPFSSEISDMKQWHHVPCIFKSQQRARATTKKVEDPTDLEDWHKLSSDDQDFVMKFINDLQKQSGAQGSKAKTPGKAIPKKQEAAAKIPPNIKPESSEKKRASSPQSSSTSCGNRGKAGSSSAATSVDVNHHDNSYREFRRLCANVANDDSHLAKGAILEKFFSKGTDGVAFRGDLYLWARMLIPGVVKRVYNLQAKQLVKLFSKMFGTDQEAMIAELLEKGDPPETIKMYFELSKKCPPAKKATLTLQQVDDFLAELETVTKEEDQMEVLMKITEKCTANDLKMILRSILGDLRIGAQAKPILQAIHPDAYEAFKASRNLQEVIDRVRNQESVEDKNGAKSPSKTTVLSIGCKPMTPVLPMLAEACKSIDQALKKCPNGMYSEIKYDGERVQVHKVGQEFKYFSRSLKPVLPHKVSHFKEFITDAFPTGDDLILDCEVLLIDTTTGKPLPFGSLGKHKKQQFKDANVCLFVFDCIYYNGRNLMEISLQKRRDLLVKSLKEIPNRIMTSEMKFINTYEGLRKEILMAINEGLEGLVLKDVESKYEPGKRHWLKVKKDYLAEGSMADTADLVVLGAYYGTGKKGGMMSIFLMGCYDSKRKIWCTVTKVSGGHDDSTLESLQRQLKMVKISKKPEKVPAWLDVHKNLIPDLVINDPETSQVWEITGAEFTRVEGTHTADSISIRFPRVTRIRNDKTPKEATTLAELKILFAASKKVFDIPDASGSNNPSPIKTGIKRHVASKSDAADLSADEQGSSGKKARLSTPPKKALPSWSGVASPRKRKIDAIDDPINNEHQSLLNVFEGMQIYISNKLEDREVLRRYIIAYGGEVEDVLSNSSHIVLNNGEKVPQNSPRDALAVKKGWVWSHIDRKLRLTSPDKSELSS